MDTSQDRPRKAGDRGSERGPRWETLLFCGNARKRESVATSGEEDLSESGEEEGVDVVQKTISGKKRRNQM